jgi:hypothetical protein
VSDAYSRRIDWHFPEWSHGAASDIDRQLVRANERERMSQTPYKDWSLLTDHSGFRAEDAVWDEALATA